MKDAGSRQNRLVAQVGLKRIDRLRCRVSSWSKRDPAIRVDGRRVAVKLFEVEEEQSTKTQFIGVVARIEVISS